MDNLDLFLSLDIALELIHAARDSLKRLELFFPPPPNASAAGDLLPSGAATRQAQAPSSTSTKSHNRRASLSVDDEDGKYIWSIRGFPGPTGVKLRETIQEIFVLLLIALRDRHLEPGFNMAVEQMRVWKPLQYPKALGTAEAKEDAEAVVAPLLGFFELVHVGDTIGSMVQVYFEREMVCAHLRMQGTS
jgi:recyclin-1